MEELISKIHQNNSKYSKIHLDTHEMACFPEQLLKVIFPQRSHYTSLSQGHTKEKLIELNKQLQKVLDQLSFKLEENIDQQIVSSKFFDSLGPLIDDLYLDAQAIYKEDPAAVSLDEIILCYPGFFAIAVYRIAHLLTELKVPLLPRIFTEHAHQRTGIDIHPKAKIGKSFCIDHGTGIVIGESTIIGNNVKLYQGVTLGSLSVSKKMANTKRHPTVEDNVVIYANTTILGGETVIGRDSIIGGNSWIIKSIPANSKIVSKNETNL